MRRDGADPIVQLSGVTCGYGGPPVLDDVDFTVHADSSVGIVGPSGSGKTTLLRVLLRTFRPQRGSVSGPRDLTIGYVPQVETVNWSFPVTVGECVRMARVGGRRLPWASGGERREADAVLERLGLGGLAARHIRELSGGQQQRMFIARALLGRPQLLLLDEPTSGVDVCTRHEILHLLADLHRHGLPFVLTTHDLNGIASHLPHLVCLNREVIGEGPPRSVLTAAVLKRTFGADLAVLEHAGMPIVIDGFGHPHNVQLRRQA